MTTAHSAEQGSISKRAKLNNTPHIESDDHNRTSDMNTYEEPKTTDIMGENTLVETEVQNVVPGTSKDTNGPSELMPITTSTTATTTTTTAVRGNNGDARSASLASSASTSSVSLTASSSPSTSQAISPILSNEGTTYDGGALSEASAVNSISLSTTTTTVTPAAAVTAVLHKKDSGTSMASTASSASSIASGPADIKHSDSSGNINSDDQSNGAIDSTISKENSATLSSITTTTTAAATTTATITGTPNTNTNTNTTTTSTRRLSQPDTAPTFTSSSSIITPTGRVLTRPLSTSKLSSTPMAAPHILPNMRHGAAGFNLAALGQLSPSASTAAAGGTMTMSRSDTLAFLSSNANNSYFTVHSGSSSSRANSLYGEITGLISGAGAGTGVGGGGGVAPLETIVLPTGAVRTSMMMSGSDAISLMDLEDSHNDIVMIDSNGNSSGSGATGAAVVGETIASASAIVSNNSQSSGSHLHLRDLPGVASTLAASSALLGHSASTSGAGSREGGSTGTISSSSSSGVAPRSSLPSLTSQAKRDAMQRAAMIAAMQQNGGAKILAAHRVGRRQDRPSRKIRFGDFHRICEIEYGFEEGKPLIANGRTLVHATRVLRVEDKEEKREEMLYLFSDVLVSGTKIKKRPLASLKSSEIDKLASKEHSKPISVEETLESEAKKEQQLKTSIEKNEPEQCYLESVKKEILLENPYAGHLENQHISRLTQLQADPVEDDERPLLKITAPQLSSLLLFDSITTRDSFVTLLNETIVAHKHHLLFQSKYLADLKKFKRHSAFSFDTSFLKTWGIPGGLNLGSIKSSGSGSNGSGNGPYGTIGQNGGNGTIGPNGTYTSSPLTSPGGGAFDPSQYQQYLNLNRPQSMAGSLFNFALNGGSFPSFSVDHSKESSYATLRGANAASALQYHHQQQQMLQQQLQNRLSMASQSSGATGSSSGWPGIDRTSSGSAFDALWFIKGGHGGGEHSKSRRSAVEAVSAPVVQVAGEETEKSGHGEDEFGEAGSAASSVHLSSSATDLPMLNTTRSAAGGGANIGNNNNNGGNNQNTNRHSSSSTFSILPLSISSSSIGHNNNNNNPTGTLRNGAGWVRDEDATVCMVCLTTKFGVLVRKHHCRLCGRVICWKCCQMKDVVVHPAEASAMGSVPQELRKPIRVCLDCIEQDAVQEHHQHQPHSPVSPLSPLQGVFGRLLSSTSSNPPLVTSATNAVGSTFTMPQGPHPAGGHAQQMPFYPRMVSYGRTGHPYPHHHRASMYRIDVERVGEEDEGEEEEGETETTAEGSTETATAGTTDSTLSQEHSSHIPPQAIEDKGMTTKSNRGSLRLMDLDPADINEEEVNNQIMTLESEVESLFIQNAPLMFGASVSSNNARVGSSAAGKTRVIRGIPKELLQSAGTEEQDEREDDEEGENEEEKTMEELLAEQDEHVKRILTR